MERGKAIEFVNGTLREINGEKASQLDLTETTKLKEFDSLDGLEMGEALRAAGVTVEVLSDEALDQLYLEGTLGDVYDIAEKYLP